MIAAQLEPDLRASYEQAIRAVREGGEVADGMVMEAEVKSLDQIQKIVADHAVLVAVLLLLALIVGSAVVIGGARARRDD